MKAISRRTCLKQISAVIAATALQSFLYPRRVLAFESAPYFPKESEIATMAAISKQFMNRFNIPGLSVSIACRGQLVYQEGFGYADSTQREQLTSSHLFRIASATKPITSTAIFMLIEQGKFGLNDFVFGKNGLLGIDYGNNLPGQVQEITVRHLLTHTCGGWENDANDPMFANPEMSQNQLIEWALRSQPLKFAPGTHFGYSNFGYCLLGRIIEKTTGQSYEEFVRQSIVDKCGITALQIAGNTLTDRVKDEVKYYGQNGENPYQMNVRRMDSHGGLLTTPTNLVKFAMHVDGFKTTPNILHAETIKAMTTPSSANPNYACGWAVNAVPNWWHIGSLPGVTSIVVRTASGLCWAAFTNTRTKGIDQGIDEMMWQIVKAVPAWNA